MNTVAIFSQRLRSAREAIGLSKADLSRKCGFTPQRYQRYENGRIPDAATVSALATTCGVTVDWLLGREVPNVETSAQGEDDDLPEPGDPPAALPPDLCRYPAACDLPGQIAAVREDVAEVREQMATLTADMTQRMAILEKLLLRLLAEQEREPATPDSAPPAVKAG